MKTGKAWVLLLLLLCGVVIGGFLGYLTRDISWLSWLDYGMTFGIGTDGGSFVLNLGVLVITFGLSIKISIASIIGVVIAFLVYRKL
ncbi:MAG: DUF4321 domain-containing protein [Lachnospiraceae bacterium]|nr:DUF4321 domain-containing protein [Lachnospiraceae bacterium]MBQ8547388.1 DUF4321 domain-containing protein [Lachnospiraceae bacterium]